MAKYGDFVYISGGHSDMEGGKKVIAYDLANDMINENFPLTEYQHFYHTCGTVRYENIKPF